MFLGGLPVFILLAILGCRLARVKLRKAWVGVIASLVFVGVFLIFLTGYGPLVNQKETREYRMTWEIQPPPSDSKITQSKVVLTFVDFPTYYSYFHSDELAQHLSTGGQEEVGVVFEVTSDYGKVRGFSELKIAGLTGWQIDPEDAGGAGGGDPEHSPWD